MAYPGYKSIHGREMGLTPRGLKVHGRYLTPSFDQGGNTYYVNSAASNASNNNDGKSPDYPLATLDGAIGKCTANQGDKIIVLSNHAETVTGAGGITADVAGISIIGIGRGNQRPRFLMDGGTTVTFLVSAADVYIENCVFAGGHDGIVRCFNITGVNFSAVDIEIEDNTTAEHFLVAFDASGADNTADGLTVIGCRWVTVDTGVTDFISHTGSIKNLTVLDNFFIADGATGAGLILSATGKVITGLDCGYNRVVFGNTATDILIDNDATTNTGMAYNNYIGHHDAAGMIAIDCDGIRLFNNYSSNEDTVSGALIPAADSIT